MGFHLGIRRLRICLLSIVILSAFSVFSPLAQASTIEDKKDHLYVHIIPHSHCDPGWLKTYKEYYQQNVKPILTNVVKELLNDETKTFNWAEISFFSLWWEEQDLNTKNSFIKLVKSGQIEFIGGGVVQNDEAASSVDVIINQVSDGHEYLYKHFGVKPRIAWQVDPFGHSSLTPTLFAQMGYEAMVINRIHHSLKSAYKVQKNMEFVWRPSPSNGNTTQMFTHVLHTHYSAPNGFDWEEGVSARVSDGNVGSRSQELVNVLKERAQSYRTNRLLVPWGDDFKFQSASYQYQNMDQLVKHINSHPNFGVTIKYSTLSRYFDEVSFTANKNKISFPTYERDFFPYADNDDSYWTGYYTSRPLVKAYHRDTLSILRSAEMTYALARVEANNFKTNKDWDTTFQRLLTGRWDTDLVAHHDGITGTARSRVVGDYLQMLDGVYVDSEKIIASMSELLLAKAKKQPTFLSAASLLEFKGESQCFPLVFQNSLGWSRTQMVSIKVDTKNVIVKDHEGDPVASQIFPVWERDGSGLLKEESEVSVFELFFQANVAPLGLKTYFVCRSQSGASDSAKISTSQVYAKKTNPQQREIKKLGESGDMFIENKYLKIEFDSDGYISSIYDKVAKQKRKLSMKYAEYATGRSGAYIFRTDGRRANDVDNSYNRLHIIKGDLVQEAQLHTSSQGKNLVKIRLFSYENEGDSSESAKFIELVHSVAPSTSNREFIVRYSTDLKAQGDFFTDNGLEMIPRKISVSSQNRRPETEYYPVQSTAFMQDVKENTQFTVLLKQVGGCSMDSVGSLELMMHRNLAQDDGRGLSERVDDMTMVNSVHWLLYEEIQDTEARRQKMSLMLEHPLRMFYAAAVRDDAKWIEDFSTVYAPLEASLPRNLHVTSLKARDSASDEIVLRFTHIWESNLHPFLSKEVNMNLNDVFSSKKFQVTANRKIGLSLGDEKKRPYYPTDNSQKLPGLQDASIASAPRSPGAKQNSVEDGVFLSKSALDNAKKNKTRPSTDKDSQNSENRPLKRSLHQYQDLNNILISPIQVQSWFLKVDPTPNYLKEIGARLFTLDGDIATLQPDHAKDVDDRKGDREKLEEQQRKLAEEEERRLKKLKEQKGENSEDEDREGNQVNPNDQANQFFGSYITSIEVRTMLIFSSLGVGLIILTYLKLQSKRKRALLLPR